MSIPLIRKKNTISVSFIDQIFQCNSRDHAPPPEAFTAAHHLISGDPISDFDNSEYPQIMIALGILRQEELNLDHKANAIQIAALIKKINKLIIPPDFPYKSISSLTSEHGSTSIFSEPTSSKNSPTTLKQNDNPLKNKDKSIASRSKKGTPSTSKTSQASPSGRPRKTKKEVRELDEIIDHLLDGEEIESPSKELLISILQRLSQREKIEIERFNYDEAKKLRDFKLNLRQHLRTVDNRSNQFIDKSEELEIVKAQYYLMKQERQKEIEELESAKEDARAQLEYELQEQRKEFVEKLPKINQIIFHPSAKLLNLRSEEKAKAKAGDFVNAKSIHQQADLLEAQERQEYHGRAFKSSAAKRRALEEAQKIKRDGFETYWESIFNLSQVKWDQESLPYIKSIEVLEKEVKTSK